MTGTGTNTFSPNTTTTRAMIVRILWNLEGGPQNPNLSTNFTDVAESAWYFKAVCWAEENNIVYGYSSTKFGPNDVLTREQLAAIMQRYAAYKGINVSNTAPDVLSSFPDTDNISTWAVDSMAWAVDAGLISGVADGQTVKLAPLGKATRAETATTLYNYCKTIA